MKLKGIMLSIMDRDLLKSWREIAQYVGLDVADTLRVAKLDGLPHFRSGGIVYCRKSRLDAWAKTVSHGTGRFMKVCNACPPVPLFVPSPTPVRSVAEGMGEGWP
ncbi:MAG: hypothetical protein SWQ30_22195 [Thermodesulfobacteriota bacterium]|nr:hypothetical protein [Thermodesulfobacteriota bacterium]